MKKILLLAPLVLFLALVGCKKIDKLLTFNVDVAQSVTIPGFFVGAQLPPVSVTTGSAESFRNNKTSREKVKDVYLSRMVLTVTNPSGSTFDFLEKIDIFINTPGANNKILLANLQTVPRGTNVITLVPTTAKLDEYLKAEKYELTVDARVIGFNANDFTVRSDATFKVTADPL
ncbi:hypothetical protein [Hymenobacter arizonensis]|uniref:Uncharacterized protein n=1 Tax=Hymenobacter arizonensis TaxID=1227077 RepID=A0A1I6B562_HYMAR|nr:hypothetical protein [Hymenobacter arizonensis]SFQ76062.1 hypothetical protein SAMN04515668_4176 [Hymenobacter arizonensis]